MKLNGGSGEILLRVDDTHEAAPVPLCAVIPEDNDPLHFLDPLSVSESDSSQVKTKRCSIVLKRLDLLKHSKRRRVEQKNLISEYYNSETRK